MGKARPPKTQEYPVWSLLQCLGTAPRSELGIGARLGVNKQKETPKRESPFTF